MCYARPEGTVTPDMSVEDNFEDNKVQIDKKELEVILEYISNVGKQIDLIQQQLEIINKGQ